VPRVVEFKSQAALDSQHVALAVALVACAEVSNVIRLHGFAIASWE
jgi:hypothetical protein